MYRLYIKPREDVSKTFAGFWICLKVIKYIIIIIVLILLLLNQHFYKIHDDFTPAFPENNTDKGTITTTVPTPSSTVSTKQTTHSTILSTSQSTTTTTEKRTTKAGGDVLQDPYIGSIRVFFTPPITQKTLRTHSKTNSGMTEGDLIPVKVYEVAPSVILHEKEITDKENEPDESVNSDDSDDSDYLVNDDEEEDKTRLSDLLILYPCCTTIIIILGMEMCGQLLMDPMTKWTNVFLASLCVGLSFVVFVVSLLASIRTLHVIMITVCVLSVLFLIFQVVDFLCILFYSD